MKQKGGIRESTRKWEGCTFTVRHDQTIRSVKREWSAKKKEKSGGTGVLIQVAARFVLFIAHKCQGCLKRSRCH